MQVLIIGSEGFIGGHCVDHFQSAGHKVWGVDLYEQPSKRYAYTKITRLSPEFDEMFATVSFDAVINAAGSGNVPYSMLHPVSDFEANCLDTVRTLDAIRKYQPHCKYIHLSSAAVYGNPEKLPIHEDDRKRPLSAYGWHKLISEQLCNEYTSVYHLHTAIIRPFSVYGEGLKKQLFWDIYQKLNNKPVSIELHGTGKESRDFIHITDLVQGIECIIQKGRMEGEVYNLASGKETTIENAVAVFLGAWEKVPLYNFNGIVREGDPLNWCANTTELQKLGFKPAMDLKKGLTGLSEWMKALTV
jgi:UDP-glucose 4-epimerase